MRLLERLWTRNEYLIASHHPLCETMMSQTGTTSPSRREFLQRAYQGAIDTLLHTWEPAREDDDPYEPG